MSYTVNNDMQTLMTSRGAPVPHSCTKSNNKIVIKQIKSYRAFVTVSCAASDIYLPDDHLKGTHIAKDASNSNLSPKMNIPRIEPTASQNEVLPAKALPSALWEMELLLGKGDGSKDISASMIERWTEAYKQMARDAQDLGIPASVIPPLPPKPTKEELRQARDHLDRMIQSFLSAAL